MTSFAQQVQEMVDHNIDKLRAVVRSSIGDVINEAQLQGPSVYNPAGGKGGRMPVGETGFLRASGQSSLTGWPSGQSVGDKGGFYASEDTYTNTTTVNADLARLELGDTFYFGWTADYALVQNVRYGFLDIAVSHWQQIVDRRVEEINRRSKK